MRIHRLVAAIAVAGLALPGPAAALDPAVKCQAVKLKLAGKYASCRLIAESNAVKNGTAPDYATCEEKIQAGWQRVEESVGGECPTLGDLGEVQDSIVECLPSTRYLIRIGIVSTHTFGAIQLYVDYGQASGGFEGAGSSVSCTVSVPDTLFARDDREAPSELWLGFVNTSSEGFESPVELATCVFESTGVAAPVEGDFSLTLTDATDPNGSPVFGVQPGIVIEKLP